MGCREAAKKHATITKTGQEQTTVSTQSFVQRILKRGKYVTADSSFQTDTVSMMSLKSITMATKTLQARAEHGMRRDGDRPW